MSSRKIIVLIMWAFVLLFLPYRENLFNNDTGWIFIFSDYSRFEPVLSDYFFAHAFKLPIFLVEVVIAVVLTKILLRGENPARGTPPAVSGIRSNETPVASSASNTNLVEELGKLNALRQSGALTDEEFAQQKAKLMGRENGETVVPEETGYPTRKIANAVAILRDAGLKEKDIVAPAQKFAWKAGQPLPPGPYMSAETGPFAVVCMIAGIAFGLISSITFPLVGLDFGFWTGLLMALLFGGLMGVAMNAIYKGMIAKHNLPPWEQIPG